MFLNLCGGLVVLTQISNAALIAVFMIAPVVALYPLAKRFTGYPQAVLGICFNSGVAIGALAVESSCPSWEIILPLYISGICWTMVYDTVYAFQVKSISLRISKTILNWDLRAALSHGEVKDLK